MPMITESFKDAVDLVTNKREDEIDIISETISILNYLNDDEKLIIAEAILNEISSETAERAATMRFQRTARAERGDEYLNTGKHGGKMGNYDRAYDNIHRLRTKLAKKHASDPKLIKKHGGDTEAVKKAAAAKADRHANKVARKGERTIDNDEEYGTWE